jgi:hypothetical protein
MTRIKIFKYMFSLTQVLLWRGIPVNGSITRILGDQTVIVGVQDKIMRCVSFDVRCAELLG